MRVLVLAPALVQLVIFVLESFRWGRTLTNRLFRMRKADVEATRLLAFQQGVFNLLLGAGVAAGWTLWMGFLPFGRGVFAGQVLLASSLGSIVVAGLTVLTSFPKLWWPALVQLLPAALALAIVFAPGA